MTTLVLTYLVNAVWQMVVVTIAGLAVDRLLRDAPPRIRCRMLTLTFVAGAVAPLTSLVPRTHAVSIAIAPLDTTLADGIAALYLLGIAIAALRLVFAWRATRRLLASSQDARGFRVSDAISAPMTIGGTILLPRSITTSPELVATALAHEQAHVRRRDFHVNALLEILALPFWFHSTARLLRNRIAELREMACDDEAALHRGARDYATALVRLASLAAPRLAVGIGSTAIERRVARLIEERRTHHASSAMIATIAIPLLLLIGCARNPVAPPIALLCGNWSLVPEESVFRNVGPRRYDAFTQSIEHGPSRVVVRQHRVMNGHAENRTWSVITDGAWRPFRRNMRGRATWRDGKLTLRIESANGHHEDAVARVSGERLIVDGKTNDGSFHTVFRRMDPEE